MLDLFSIYLVLGHVVDDGGGMGKNNHLDWNFDLIY